MTQYNSVNMKLANSQLNKLKSAMKNSTVTLRFSSNILLVLMMKLVFHTGRQVARLCKSF